MNLTNLKIVKNIFNVKKFNIFLINTRIIINYDANITCSDFGKCYFLKCGN